MYRTINTLTVTHRNALAGVAFGMPTCGAGADARDQTMPVLARRSTA